MKLNLLLLGASALSLVACQTPPTKAQYTKFRVTNYRSELIADWIAEGGYRKAGTGYRITAVERTSAPPHMQRSRYPNGWETTIDGPHIVHWRCGKPLWLYELDGY